jgi:hypothetical protein
MQEGPSLRHTYHCVGCIFLETEDWSFFGENDEIDRGTDATCNKAGRTISSYWYSRQLAPQWCPFLEGK